ncbi:hypothetical protein DL96DRAFT_1555393 [Flagelloscypha sp. PMI_526]|nr:hypothetical protein DL96DRAFT_1555393 [Flagelloscypha sp. PMI_526]
MSSTPFPWTSLPIEMKLSVVDNLDLGDARNLSRIDRESYRVCLPVTFQAVQLKSQCILQHFVNNVPTSYCRYIRQLELCTEGGDDIGTPRSRSDAVLKLLSAARCLETLALNIFASLDATILPGFTGMADLHTLAITNWEDEAVSPLSERLVVSIAASLPALEHLSLENITRSSLHAPELIGAYPVIPIVEDDDDIPMHPILGSALNLPSLLRIPTLRTLSIRDAHLGDKDWVSTDPSCSLEILDLGSSIHEPEPFNQSCIECIMACVGPKLGALVPAAPVSSTTYPFGNPNETPLKHLRKVTLPPLFPVDSVVDTMSSLAGSPIESLSVHCFEDDVIDTCSALEDFLSLRVERSSTPSSSSDSSSSPSTPTITFYDKLTRIDVNISSDDSCPSSPEEKQEQLEATKRLLEFCADLKIQSAVAPAGRSLANKRARASSVDSALWPTFGSCLTVAAV